MLESFDGEKWSYPQPAREWHTHTCAKLSLGQLTVKNDGLGQSPRLPEGAAEAIELLTDPDPGVAQSALTLLIAWRVDAAAVRIADEVLTKGASTNELSTQLAEWNNPARRTTAAR